MNKKKYFIAEDDVQKGPFSTNELKEMSISKSTLIWKEGFDDWTEAGKIEKLQIFSVHDKNYILLLVSKIRGKY